MPLALADCLNCNGTGMRRIRSWALTGTEEPPPGWGFEQDVPFDCGDGRVLVYCEEE